MKVVECIMEVGAITSSTILANGEAFSSVPDIVKRHSSISYGVHLNLTEFKPLTNATIFHNYAMTNDKGEFIKSALHNVNYTKELKYAIYKEWSAQLIKLLDAGIQVTHIDGHHHCHTQYELYEVMKKLANDFGIRKIRLNYVYPLVFMCRKRPLDDDLESRKPAGEAMMIQRRLDIRKRIETAIKNRIWYCRTIHDFETANLFFSYTDFIKRYDLIRRKKTITIELMCHPGNPLYRDEAALLMKNTLKKSAPFSLINYKVV